MIKTLVPRPEITILHVVDKNFGGSEDQNPLKTMQTEMLRLMEEAMSFETPIDQTVIRYI